MPLARHKATKALPSTTLASSSSLPVFPAAQGRNSKVSLKILVAKGIHVAGTTVQGELEVSVKDHALGLGEIGIELAGTEELRNRDYTSTRRLLYRRLLFQGPSLPPSNAVVAGSTPIQGGYYPALRGRTRFAFSFDIPKELPSTCAFGANGVVRYELRAFASSLYDGDVDLRSEKKDVLVVERWDDWRKGNWTSGVEKQAEHRLEGREGGTVSLKAGIGQDELAGSLPRLFWWREVDQGIEGKGGIEVRVRIKNATKRHIAGINMALIRRLRLIRSEQSAGPAPPQISTSVTSIDYLGTDHDVGSGSERELLVTFQLPRHECWTVRKGSLFDLDCYVRVAVEGGFLGGKLSVELPVYVAHPFSVSTTAQRLIDEERRLQAPPPPDPVPFVRSPTSMLDFAASPEPPYRRETSPAHSGHHYASSVVSVSPSAPPRRFQHPIPSSSQTQPSIQPAYQHPYPLPTPHNGYVSFDSSVPDLTPSRFLGSLQSQQPNQVFVSPESTMSIAVGPPHSPSSNAYYAAPPPPPPSLAQTAEPVTAQRRQHFGHPPSVPYVPPSLAQDERRQYEQSIGPVHPYSAAERVQHARIAVPVDLTPRTASAPASYQPEVHLPVPPSCPSPAPEPHRHHSLPTVPPFGTSGYSLHRTPPPPSPSSQFRQRSVSPSPSFHQVATGQPDPGLLDTIGEDGESQAGTARSTALTTSALAALRAGDDDASSIQSVRVGNSPGRTSVQDLEELVAEEERNQEKERDEPTRGLEKTLPELPKPSPAMDGPSSLRDIFSAIDKPASPLPAPPRSPSPARSAVSEGRSEGGLAALRVRLARSTTPLQQPFPPSSSPALSRSPSPSKFSASPDLRALSPSLKLELPSAGSSALRARSLSRASRRQDKDLEKALRDAEQDPSEAVRKALSARTGETVSSAQPDALPPNVSSAVFKAVSAMKSLETLRSRDDAGNQEAAKVTTRDPTETPSAREPFMTTLPSSTQRPARYQALPMEKKEEVAPRPTSPPARPPSRPVFPSGASKRHTLPALPDSAPSAKPTSLDQSSFVDPPSQAESFPSSPLCQPECEAAEPEREASPVPVVTAIDSTGRKVVDAVEMKHLKQDARARVSSWLADDPVPPKRPLSTGSPWSLVHKSDSSSDVNRKRRTIEFARPAPPPPSSPPRVHTARVITRSPSPEKRATQEPTVAQLIAAETRAAMRETEGGPLRNKSSPVVKGLDSFLAALKKDEEFQPSYQGSSARGGKGGKVASVTSIWASREETERTTSPPPVRRGHKATKSLSTAQSPTAAPLSPLGSSANRLNRRSVQPSPPTQRLSAAAPAKPFLNTTLGRSGGSTTSSSPTKTSENSAAGAIPRPATTHAGAGGAKVKDLLARYQQQLA